MTLEELAKWLDEEARVIELLGERLTVPRFSALSPKHRAAAAACRELINKRARDARSDDPELERLTDAALEKCRLP